MNSRLGSGDLTESARRRFRRRSQARRILRNPEVRSEWRPYDRDNPTHGRVWLTFPIEAPLLSLHGRIGENPKAVDPREYYGDDPHTAYFNADGTPADERTRQIVSQVALDHLSVLTARRLVESKPVTPQTDSKEEWNRALAESGLSMHAGRNPNLRGYNDSDLDEAEKKWQKQKRESITVRPPKSRRPLVSLPHALFRKAVVVRLAMIFDRQRTDPVIKQCSAFLCSDRWREWSDRAALTSLLEQIDSDPQLGRLMHELEMVLYLREELRHAERVISRPRAVTWTLPSGNVEFRFPAYPRTGPRSALTPRRRRAVMATLLTLGHRDNDDRRDPRFMAAAAWLARHYISGPEMLTGNRLTLTSAARFFGVTRRQAQYAATTLRREVAQRLRSS